MDQKITDYLSTVTAGLKDDAELRLDVQAELASHLEDKAEELQRGGASEEDSRTQAMAALGELTEVAAGLERGNRRRLNQRAWIRRGLRLALVPAAVVVAILCSDLQWAAAMHTVRELGGGNPAGAVFSWQPGLPAWLPGTGRRPEVALLKATPRELWESDPQNRIYYAEFVSHDVAGQSNLSNEHARQQALTTLETARTLDPDNARYDYLRAAILLEGACDVHTEQGEKGPDGQRGLGTISWEIRDRSRVDQAMAHLQSGLGKPEFRRYGKEMLALRLAAMGPADRLLQRIERIALSAAALLPDLAKLRELARVAYLYGDTLAAAGQVEAARPYLDAWKTLTVQLNADTWTLIDCLVVSAIANGFPEHCARVYDRLGLAGEAARTRHAGEVLGRPGKEWRERRNDPAAKAANLEHEKEMRLYAGILTSVLLPALNEWPTRQEYDASRRLEYAVAMQAGLTLLSAALLVVMLACLVISLRWRFLSDGAAIPILLLPDWRRALRLLVLGVLLPLALFAALVLCVPGGGQSYSARAGMHRVLAEFLLLTVAILLLPAWLAVREARRRCRELGLACPRSAAAWGLVPLLLGCAAVAAVWWVPPRPERPCDVGLAIIAATALILVVTALAAALFLLLANARHGLYCGTVARSLIPLFAAGVIVLCLSARPALLQAERRCIAADTILLTAPDEVGFSRIETKLTARLQKAVADAAAGLQKG